MDGAGRHFGEDVSEEALRTRYRRLRGEIERVQEIETGQAAALHFAAYAYGETLEHTPLMQRATHAAQLFCIAAAGIVPILLFLRILAT